MWIIEVVVQGVTHLLYDVMEHEYGTHVCLTPDRARAWKFDEYLRATWEVTELRNCNPEFTSVTLVPFAK